MKASESKAEAILMSGFEAKGNRDYRTAKLAFSAAARAYRQAGRNDYAAEAQELADAIN